ncbi:MAG: flagellum-specific ATP synthase FliI, partial [Methylococcaceae bacterium]|nr:flagellum-specific ATP synthase FliI [Methylococcaceae bacterium]
MIPTANRSSIWIEKLKPYTDRADIPHDLIVEGKLSRMVGLTLEAVGCRAAIGSRCEIETKNGRMIEAEVVGFSGSKVFLMPTAEVHGLEPDCR